MNSTESSLTLDNIFQFFKKNKFVIIQYSGLLFVLIIFYILSNGRLLSSSNLKTIIRQLVVIYSLSLGLVFVFTHGGFDVSIGAVLALAAAASTYVMNATNSVILGFIVAILISIFFSLTNIYISIKFGLMSVISALAIMFLARGILTYISSISFQVISVDLDLSFFRSNITFMLIYIIIVGLIAIFLYNYTKIGKANRFIGENIESAKHNGIQVKKYKVIAYLISGTMVGFASIFYLARSGTVSNKAGMGLEMDVIVTLILGGMSLNGGSRSRISSAIIGSITFCFLNNGLILAGVSPVMTSLFKGLIFLIVVALIIKESSNSRVLPL